MYRYALPLAAILSLTACEGPSAVDGVAKGKEVSSGPFGLIKSDAVKVDTSSAFKGLDKVAIGSFTVGFATYKTASTKTSVIGHPGGSSNARNTLKGIDDATMQKITDEAYKSFLSDLKSKGYTVVGHDEIMKFADFSSTKSYPNPYEDSDSGFFGPKSTTRYFAPSSFNGVKLFMGDLPGTMGGFATDNPTVGAAKYASANGVKVLHVVYVLDFANADSSGGLRWTNQVKVGQGMTVVPTVSKIGLIADQGGLASDNGNIILGQPITSEKQFATISDATSDSDVVGENVVNGLAGLTGAVGMSRSKDFEFNARPADFKAAATDAVKQANTALIGKMAGLK